MLFKILSLTCLLLTNLLIQPITCALPNNIQDLELDDITSLWDKFPVLIDKIKEAGRISFKIKVFNIKDISKSNTRKFHTKYRISLQ